MAFMKFRESNQVKWIGSRPGHNGTQVYGTGYAAGAVTVVMYTVTAGKTLFLTAATLCSRESVAAAAGASLVIYTSIPGVWRYLFNHLYDVAGHQVSEIAYPFPLEIPEAYTIRVLTDHVNTDAFATIWGWEE